ncbi:MAG: hypothetical protein KatS3mg105_2617 [Gemmatales bacterium]|nr:MAG: hypothetical protein KatS3mg105_2617 [Gemmatales bacterium]
MPRWGAGQGIVADVDDAAALQVQSGVTINEDAVDQAVGRAAHRKVLQRHRGAVSDRHDCRLVK